MNQKLLYLKLAEKALFPYLQSGSKIAFYCTATSGRETPRKGLRPWTPFQDRPRCDFIPHVQFDFRASAENFAVSLSYFR